jgi:hypothetical protein
LARPMRCNAIPIRWFKNSCMPILSGIDPTLEQRKIRV